MGRMLLSVATDPVADLEKRLRRRSRNKRSVIAAWFDDHELGEHAVIGKRVALALIARRSVESKLAGMLVLSEQLGDQLRATDVPSFAKAITENLDGDLVPWFASNVLAVLLAREPGRAAIVRAIFDWRNTDDDRRRASCIALACVAREYGPIAYELAATVVWSHDDADQLAVAELVHALAVVDNARAEPFIRRYARFMSRACIKRIATAYPAKHRRALLDHWKRATTI